MDGGVEGAVEVRLVGRRHEPAHEAVAEVGAERGAGEFGVRRPVVEFPSAADDEGAAEEPLAAEVDGGVAVVDAGLVAEVEGVSRVVVAGGGEAEGEEPRQGVARAAVGEEAGHGSG